jgi:hypothetical protein
LSRTRTSRALSNLKRLGFIIETAAADPQHERPRRWRLTMYVAGGRPATKDFMRANSVLKNSFRGCSDATETPVSAAPVQQSTSAARATPRPEKSKFHEKINSTSDLPGQSLGSGRASQSVPYGFTGAAHIEASQELLRTQRVGARDEASVASSAAEPSGPQIPGALLSQCSPSPCSANEPVAVKATDQRKVTQSKRLRPSRSADARQGELFAEPGITTTWPDTKRGRRSVRDHSVRDPSSR